ncbi:MULTISPECIES: DMT family transporter [Lentibacter]|uniref:EamA-like transporter family protein n=2 Tax=Lentibacter algarum TaxID=576131 RepID=A0A1H3K0P5_9RHOB|nr:DMT family transporter [Lentibacter algarum]WIF32205.1 Permease of the drug/metabolite transporter (DMT) superfamily protein [Lentibacter algarum]SDY45772.1 EamA-like transporter family protein [Lentibacter algarum]
MSLNLGPMFALLIMGAGWGITTPLSKIAVSTGHQPLGLVFWQLVIGAVLLEAIVFVRGGRLALGRRQITLYLAIALLGTILPNTASYRAAAHLPAGVMSIVIAMVPMFAFPIALALGQDRFSIARVVGLGLGLGGVALLVGPEASLPDRAMVAFIPLALIAPFFYGLEGNFVGKFGTAGLDPIEVLFGASVFGAVLSLPLALGFGHWLNPLGGFGAPESALVLSSIVHALVYAGYVWLVGRAGAVFAAQVSYLVTIFGVGWAMLILDEAYSGYIWGALGLMLLGMFLVQPRDREEVAA